MEAGDGSFSLFSAKSRATKRTKIEAPEPAPAPAAKTPVPVTSYKKQPATAPVSDSGDDADAPAAAQPPAGALPAPEAAQACSFKELGLSDWLCSVCDSLGMSRPTQVQQGCIPAILQVSNTATAVLLQLFCCYFVVSLYFKAGLMLLICVSSRPHKASRLLVQCHSCPALLLSCMCPSRVVLKHHVHVFYVHLFSHHSSKRPFPLLPARLQGRDVIGTAHTGSGKTAAFALPILQKLAKDPYGTYALVLTPTRELAFQIQDQFRALGAGMSLRQAVVIGGMDMQQQVSGQVMSMIVFTFDMGTEQRFVCERNSGYFTHGALHKQGAARQRLAPLSVTERQYMQSFASVSDGPSLTAPRYHAPAGP